MESDPTISIVLDMPPGMNQSYAPARNGKGLRKTTAANDWAAYAKWNVHAQRQGAHLPYRFSILIVLPDSSRLDIDAGIKQILDACAHGGAIFNDKDCRSLHVEYDEREGVLVELCALPDVIPEKLRKSRAKAIAKRANAM